MSPRFLVLLLLPLVSALPSNTSFTITDLTWAAGTPHEVRLKQLLNRGTGESLTVIVSPGGKVEQLALADRGTGKLRDVLQGHSGNASAVWANEHWRGAMLAPFANRIANGTYDFDGRRHYMPRNEEPARECALHGFLYDKPLEVVEEQQAENHAAVTLSHRFGADPGYPFQVQMNITYILERVSVGSSQLRIRVSATNTANDGSEAPFFMGMHPYFKVKDVSTARVVMDRECADYLHVLMAAGAPRAGTLIPTLHTTPWFGFNSTDSIGGTTERPTYLDDEFKAAQIKQCTPPGTMRTMIRDEEGGAVLWQDSSFRYNQIFTGSRELWGDQNIAFEPMSAKADAYNNHDGLTILSDAETWAGEFGIYAATSFLGRAEV